MVLGIKKLHYDSEVTEKSHFHFFFKSILILWLFWNLTSTVCFITHVYTLLFLVSTVKH